MAHAFRKLLGAIVAIALLVTGVVFSVAVFAVFAVLGLITWAYFYWKTRKLREQLRQQTGSRSWPPPQEQPMGDIIEGEVVVVSDQISRDSPSLAQISKNPVDI